MGRAVDRNRAAGDIVDDKADLVDAVLVDVPGGDTVVVGGIVGLDIAVGKGGIEVHLR